MSKNTGDLMQQRLKEVAAEKEAAESSLAKMQDKLRAKPEDLSLRAQVHDAKMKLFQLSDEYGDLARAVSAMQGGKNYTPAA